MILNLEFLDCIKEPFICSVDGDAVVYENGSAARACYMSAVGRYALKNITVENGMIKVFVEDMTDEIDANNRKWIEDVRKRTGRGPNLFDGC